MLAMSGERKAENEDKREGYVRVERAYGAFRRSLTLPEGIEPEAVSASFDNGVLEVRIPEPEERKPRRVAIQVATARPRSRATRPVGAADRRPACGPRSARARGRTRASASSASASSWASIGLDSASARAGMRSTNHGPMPASTTTTAPPSPARWMNFSAHGPRRSEQRDRGRPRDPPSAFQNRKFGQGMRVTPAIHAAVMRSPATQRPRKTAFGPWRSKNGSPTVITGAVMQAGAGRGQRAAAELAADRERTLSPRIAATAATAMTASIYSARGWRRSRR